jgi:hypothetical protein
MVDEINYFVHHCHGKAFCTPYILEVLHRPKLCNTHSGSLTRTKELSIAIRIFRLSHHGQKNVMCAVPGFDLGPLYCMQISYGAFTLDVKSA